MTRLSCRRSNLSCFPRLAGLARLSLLALFVSSLSSCLVDDPPPYTAPKQTPPRLDYVGATPLLNQIIVANPGDIIPFSIPVESEDAGQPLTCLLLLDYAGGRDSGVAGAELPASTLETTGRVISLSYSVPSGVAKQLAPGCHRFTLRVTHKSNLDTTQIPVVFDPHDLAEAYWWANIGVDAASANTLKDCKDPVQ